jgi:hypothetical protein
MIYILQRNPFIPEELISYLKNRLNLRHAYQTRIRHYTLEEHTLLVLGVFEKNFGEVTLACERSLFRLILALHDIGKPKAFAEGNKNYQYKYTVEIINNLYESLPFSNEEKRLCISMVCSDTLGLYQQNFLTLEMARKEILNLAEAAGIPATSFFKLLTIYYQCDIASYTADAGGKVFLEHLFSYQGKFKIFDAVKERLMFSNHFENRFIALENAISL